MFDEKPNYQYLRGLFRRVLKSYRLENDGRYDWMDPSIKKNPSRLPPHAKGSDGNLRQDLLVPANILFRESYKEGRGERTDSGLASYKRVRIYCIILCNTATSLLFRVTMPMRAILE